MKNKLKHISSVMIISLFIIILYSQYESSKYNYSKFYDYSKSHEYSKAPYLKEGYLIAHALGGLDGQMYTNSLEAFLHNYQIGHKLFEVDLVFTQDNILATLHDREKEPIKSFAIESEHARPYTILSFEDLCKLMLKYNDVYIITDTKNFRNLGQAKRTFSYMDRIIKTINTKLAERFVIQVYNQDMFYYLSQNYNFKNYLYTLYVSHDSNQQVIDFVKKTKIPVVTLPQKRVSSDFIKALNDAGVFAFVHTINDINEINELFKIGVYGIYTDFVAYDDMKLTRKERYLSLYKTPRLTKFY